MKMFFLLKNNARRGMGEKECSKRERKRGRKRPPKFANSKTDGRLGGNSQILKAGEALFKNFRTILRRSHNVNKSE
ncbi:hypothetical protein DW192_07945 [Segatella copri]|uniref:Uncharacterized protein n=1 Tax=Segatella copri TaxID=165179 RepID=A0A3R6EEC0_9BACT|nr:hypothetical protein DW192_07945 [Segatella copri]